MKTSTKIFLSIAAVVLAVSYFGSTPTSQGVQSSIGAVQPAPVVSTVQPTLNPPDRVSGVISTSTPETAYAPNGTYKNVDGVSVQRPYYSNSAPSGATAQCRDGSYSFSQHRQGTCSHHGGVATWL